MADATIADIERITATRIKRVTQKVRGNDVWLYTRVSNITQTEGYSIQVQDEESRTFATNLGFTITDTFGGTHESASSDLLRKEFNRLRNKLAKTKKPPFAIVVYDASRFSRTGSGGISIMQELKTKYGVYLYSACDGVNNFDSDRGEIALGKQLLSAQEDNLNRKDKITASLKKFTRLGKWLGVAPLGYDHHGLRVKDPNKVSAQQRIIINDDGKKLKMAWQWKLRSMRDKEILHKLSLKGLKITKQKLSRIWRNPFYCGLIISNRTDGKAIKGHWEKMVTYEEFKRIQKIIKRKVGEKKNEKIPSERPLQGTLKCGDCGRKLTGYHRTITKKNIIVVQYYNCQKCNKATFNSSSTRKSTHEGLHEKFITLLRSIAILPALKPLIIQQLTLIYTGIHTEQADEQKTLKAKTDELEKKLDVLERKNIFEDLRKDLYEKYKTEIIIEQREIATKLQELDFEISNLKSYLNDAMLIAEKPYEIWQFGDIELKHSLQKLLFPNGLRIDREKREYLTLDLNTFFSQIATISSDCEGKKKGLLLHKQQKSYVVAGVGLEPTTFGL